MIKPTVGRKVWYRPSQNDLIGLGAMSSVIGQPLDATVLAVWSDRCVNVQVLDIMGKPFTKTSIKLIQEGDEAPKALDGTDAGGYVEWMPYQTGQAKSATTAKTPSPDVFAAGPGERIARVCHEVNRAYCEALGDTSQASWEDAPAWQRESARMGVDLHLSGDFGPEASHIGWMRQKLSEGWKYGPVKDAEKKEHPCMVPFSELSREQQAKDFIFRAVVHAMK